MGGLTTTAEGREAHQYHAGLPPHRGRLSHGASNFMREFL